MLHSALRENKSENFLKRSSTQKVFQTSLHLYMKQIHKH